jgi:hypothetical protein
MILLVWDIVIVCVLTNYVQISYHRTKFQRLSNNDFELDVTSELHLSAFLIQACKWCKRN